MNTHLFTKNSDYFIILSSSVHKI